MPTPAVLLAALAPVAVLAPFQEPAPAPSADGPGAADPALDSDGLAVVRSKAEYLALDREQRDRFSRANRPPVTIFVEGGGEWSGPSDLDDASGDVSVWRLGAGGGLSFRVSDTADFILRAGGEFSFYDFEDAPGLIPGAPASGEPVEDVYLLDFSPIFRVLPEDGWQWLVGGRVRSSGEPDADFGDTLTYGGLAGVSYPVTDSLRLGLGLSVSTRLEGGVFVLPVPIIEWDITRDLVLRTRDGGFALDYWFADSWSLGLEAGFDRREYRLADDNAAVPGGSFTDRRIPVALAVTYSPSPRTVVTARIGSSVWGELEFNDEDDHEIAQTDLGAGLLAGFDLRIAF